MMYVKLKALFCKKFISVEEHERLSGLGITPEQKYGTEYDYGYYDVRDIKSVIPSRKYKGGALVAFYNDPTIVVQESPEEVINKIESLRAKCDLKMN